MERNKTEVSRFCAKIVADMQQNQLNGKGTKKVAILRATFPAVVTHIFVWVCVYMKRLIKIYLIPL